MSGGTVDGHSWLPLQPACAAYRLSAHAFRLQTDRSTDITTRLHIASFTFTGGGHKKGKFLRKPHGPLGVTDLHLSSPQPGTSLHCEITDTGLEHHMMCLFFPQLLGPNQIILLAEIE